MEVKSWIIGLVVIVFIFVGIIIFRDKIVDRIAERTLQKMQQNLHKPYSPSPFGPGYDPDKMDGYKGYSTEDKIWEQREFIK